jgi:uncharacterized protein (DUF433 family)
MSAELISYASAVDPNRVLMRDLDRITFNPEVMGGKPCIRGMRVTVGTMVGLVATDHSAEDILTAYPYLEAEDISQALAYGDWRVEEIEVPLSITMRVWVSYDC